MNSIKNKANLMDLISATGLVILLKLDPLFYFWAQKTLKLQGWTQNNDRAPPVLLYEALSIISKPLVN